MNLRSVALRGARVCAAALLLLALLVPFVAFADTAIPPYAGYVTDTAHVFDDARRAQLEGFLDQVQKQTGVQFAVLTMPDLGDEDAESYKVRAFKKWGIGNADRDDGLLLLVAMKEHRIVFETGYGLEGTLPDGWQARMLRTLAVPRFREGHPDEGIIAAVLAASQRIAADKHVTLTWDGRELRYSDDGAGGSGIPAWVIALVMFLIINAVLRALRGGGRFRGGGFGGYGGYGGWGGGFGGGFGGGGGGGGGSSFGGFGGGSSGGGGGGASW